MPQEIVTEAHLPTGVETHKSAADTASENRYQRWTLLIQWLSFLAIVGYAGLVYLQWREMITATDAGNRGANYTRKQAAIAQQSLETTIENFRNDERAWIGYKPTIQKPMPVVEHV